MIPFWKYTEFIDDNTKSFEYLAFPSEKQIKIYDSDLKLIKTISKPREEYIDNVVSTAVGQKVYHRGAPPTMAMYEAVEYPLLRVRKQGGQNQVILERKYADENTMLLFTTSYDVSTRKDKITIKKDDKNIAQFDVNVYTGEIYYPKMYI